MKKASILAFALLVSTMGSLIPMRSIKAASCVLQGNTITVDCEFAPDTYYYTGTLTVDPLVTVTAGSQSSPGIVYIYADDIVLNGTISANAMGSAGGSGTCPGTSGASGGGGCHAGFGGRGSGNIAGGSSGYGFAEVPTNVGSGGGDDTGVGGTQGGRGGGAIWLGTYSATGTLSFGTLGAITANGENAISNEGGGGSGGTINIEVGDIDVTDGVISANGGNGAGSGASGGGGGGGGMVAVRYTSTSGTFTQTRQASGGNRGTTTSLAAQVGGPGTVYVKDMDDDIKVLTVTNDKADSPFTSTEMVNSVNTFNLLGGAKMLIDDQLEVDDAFTYTALANNPPELWIRQGYFQTPDEAMTFSGINIHHTGTISGLRYMTFDNGLYSVEPSSARFSAGTEFGSGLGSLVLSGTSTTTFSATGTGTFYAGALEAKSGATLTHLVNSTTALGRQNALSISATNSIEIDSGATVSLAGRGYAAANGPGAGVAAANNGGGASHGGNGGTSSVVSPAPTIGATYGSVTAPIEIGSGGTYTNGAAGGGAIKLASGGTVTIDTSISVNGSASTVFGGAGSGGSIWIDAPTITTTGSATLSANGGASSAGCGSGGAGGGGRIALTGYTTLSGSIARTAYGGVAGCASSGDGGAGTIFVQSDTDTNGALLVVNNDPSSGSATTQVYGTSETYDDITISNGADYLVPTTSTLTLASGGTLTGGGTVQASLTVNGAATFDPGVATFTFNDLDVVLSGVMSTVTNLSVTSAAFTESGTGTFSSTVSTLSLTSATFTDASENDGLNLPDITMSSSTYNNNTSDPGLHFTSFSVPSGSTFNDNSSAYYSMGSGLTALSVSGTYSRGSDNMLFLDTLSVPSGGTVTHLANSTTALGKQYALDVSATSTITISSSASMTANGKGYATAQGPGMPGDAASCNHGASHGGTGGLRSTSCLTNTIGPTYGSVAQPIEMGSGGGTNGGSTGGAGGGSIRLTAVTVTVDGTISANGSAGTSIGGGGSGGSIWIDAATITTTGAGSVTAAGGASGTSCVSGGGGGGGRVALTGWTTLSGSVTRTAYGGLATCSSAQDGGAGTVFTQSDTDANGTLVVVNNAPDNSAATTQVYGTSETYDDITISNGADYLVPTTSTLTLASGGTLTGGGTVQASLTVNGAATFDPGVATFTFNDLDVVLSGVMSTVTNLSVTSAAFTESGTGTFSSTVSTLSLTSATFTDASENDGLNLPDITMSSSTYNNNTSDPGLHFTSFSVPSGSTFNDNSSAYYSMGSGLTALSVSGTYSRGSDNMLFLDTLSVPSGGTVTHLANSTTALGKQYALDVSATTSVTVSSGGSINGNSKGYSGNNGPGAGVQGSNCGGGGSYAGNGGQPGCGATVATIGDTYGSATAPTDIGSGGTYTAGGAGGGAVKIAAPTVTVDGTVSANGANGGSFSGGGAGGSVWIVATTITTTGSGSVTATGGSTGVCSGGGSAGGGRVAFTGYTTLSGSITRNAYGGDATCSTAGDGGAGTIYTKAASETNGNLLVENNNQSNVSNTTQVAGSSETYDLVTIKSGSKYVVPSGSSLALPAAGDCAALVGGGTNQASLTINGTLSLPSATCTIDDLDLTVGATANTLTNLTMTNGTFTVNTRTSLFPANGHNRLVSLTLGSGGGLTTVTTDPFFIDVLTANSGSSMSHAANTTTAAASNTLYVSATTSITVSSGVTIDLLGLGYEKSEGPGAGSDSTTASGGAHGGTGGSSTVLGANTATYGSAEFPSDLGSGGGDDTNTATAGESEGGGSIHLVTPVAGSITISSNVVVDGAIGNASNDDGGGAGGSIWIEGGAITLSGDLSADGGAGDSANAGCGGGGRIAVHYNTLDYSSGTATAATGCVGARAGTTGSVYFTQFGEVPVPPTNGVTEILPTVLEVGQNMVFTASATDDDGVETIEIYIDGTAPGNLVKTCTFDPVATPASCQYETGNQSLGAGSHSVTVKSYDDLGLTDTDTTNFSVAGRTSSNQLDLSRTKVGETAVATLTFTLDGDSTGTLTLTFPDAFTVDSAPTSGSGCLSAFGFTATTMYATKTACTGTVTMTGGTVTNPSEAGGYFVTWTNDNGSGQVFIVEDDEFHITGSVDPVLTFNVGTQTATCDGTFTGYGGTLALGGLNLSSVASSDVSSVPHICARLTTNAPGGAVVTVRSENAALASIGTPADTVPSSTATLTAGTTGYGLCVGDGGSDTGRDSTTPVGATPVRSSPFNGSCSTSGHQVGGLTVSPQTIWSVSDPTQNAFARIFIKASMGPGVENHNDYQDVLTFIATATY